MSAWDIPLLNYLHSWYWSCQPRPVKSTWTKIIIHKLMHDSLLIIAEGKKKNYVFIENDILIQICPIYSMSDLPKKIIPPPKSTTRCHWLEITFTLSDYSQYRYLNQDRRTRVCIIPHGSVTWQGFNKFVHGPHVGVDGASSSILYAP